MNKPIKIISKKAIIDKPKKSKNKQANMDLKEFKGTKTRFKGHFTERCWTITPRGNSKRGPKV